MAYYDEKPNLFNMTFIGNNKTEDRLTCISEMSVLKTPLELI